MATKSGDSNIVNTEFLSWDFSITEGKYRQSPVIMYPKFVPKNRGLSFCIILINARLDERTRSISAAVFEKWAGYFLQLKHVRLFHGNFSTLQNLELGFFDRELCSKVLKEALLLFFFLVAWNHEQKMFQMGEKNVPKRTKNIRNKDCFKFNRKTRVQMFSWPSVGL